MGDRWENAPSDLVQNISNFQSILVGLHEELKSWADTKWHSRFLRRGEMGDALVHYRDTIDDAVQSFQTINSIHIRLALAGQTVHDVVVHPASESSDVVIPPVLHEAVPMLTRPTERVNVKGGMRPGSLTRHNRSRSEARIRQSDTKPLNAGTGMADAGEPPIYFYERDHPFYEFTNGAPHTVRYKGKDYPTAEHLYQARKFIDSRPELAEQIRTTPNPRAALDTAARLRKLQRSDWYNVNISVMEEVVLLKFTQHRSLHELLLATGDRELVVASPVDSFWGYGRDRKGRNELGKALMRIRDRLQREALSESAVSTDPIAASSRTASQVIAQPLFFYEPGEPFWELMNISQHSVWHAGKLYSTAEHLFQAFMFLNTPRADLAEEIRVQDTWISAVRVANNNMQHRRKDWDEVKISCMEAVVAAKFSQHDDALTMLLSTGERQLVFNNPFDAFWGCGKDGQGKNEFGKILAKMRTVLALRRTTRAAAIAIGGTARGCPTDITFAMPT